jgi:hypothetical protein
MYSRDEVPQRQWVVGRTTNHFIPDYMTYANLNNNARIAAYESIDDIDSSISSI